jgi:hypothetical protein
MELYREISISFEAITQPSSTNKDYFKEVYKVISSLPIPIIELIYLLAFEHLQIYYLFHLRS